MISIIICSINKTFAQQVQQNIAATIGVEWEAIVIDNTQQPKSITAVYNQGAAMARYPLLCFAHEDILFNTNDWGKIIVAAFAHDDKLGLIGVAGSKYKSQLPSGWYTGIAAFDCCNIRHLNKEGITEIIYFNPTPGALQQQAVVLDGVFLCSPKAVWQQVLFDESLLTGFHLYDIDYSARVAAQYKAMVTYEIDILHITKGNHFENNWLAYTLLWHQKMRHQLPMLIHDGSIDKSRGDSRIVKTWLVRLKHEKLSLANKCRWLLAVKIWQHPIAWPNIPLFILYSFIPGRKITASGK